MPWFALFGRPKNLPLFLLPLIGGIKGSCFFFKLHTVLLVLELLNSPRPSRILNDSSHTCNVCLTPVILLPSHNFVRCRKSFVRSIYMKPRPHRYVHAVGGPKKVKHHLPSFSVWKRNTRPSRPLLVFETPTQDSFTMTHFRSWRHGVHITNACSWLRTAIDQSRTSCWVG